MAKTRDNRGREDKKKKKKPKKDQAVDLGSVNLRHHSVVTETPPAKPPE